MRQTYKQINLRQPSLDTIATANEIINEYSDLGLKLTLRQLYYQFVARDIISNTQKSYKNLGRLLSDGRLAGLIDWNAIEDRTRFLRGNTNWNSPVQLVQHYASTFRIDMWKTKKLELRRVDLV